MQINDIKAKIAKLLAMADPKNGATEGEIQAAMAAAMRLMEKFNISASEFAENGTIKIEHTDFVKCKVFERSQVDPWHLAIANAVAKMCAGKIIKDTEYPLPSRKARHIFWLVALPNDVELYKLFYSWIDAQMRCFARYDKQITTRIERDSFYYGFSIRIAQRIMSEMNLAKERATLEHDSDAAKSQLVFVGKTQLLTKAAEHHFGALKYSSGPRRSVDSSAYKRGMSAADSAQLNVRKKLS